MKPEPVLILGQGLAGTALAWQLWERRVPFVIVDRDEALTSSKVAAGLLTPVTGMRWSLSADYARQLAEALAFYRRRQRELGQRFVYLRPNVRYFTEPKQLALWQKRSQEPSMARYIDEAASARLASESGVFINDLGAVQLRHAGYLDTAAYLAASRAFFISQGCWRSAEISEAELLPSPEGVSWQGESYSHAIHCLGWEAMHGRWFDWLPWQPARGTILTLTGDFQGEQRLLHRGLWLQPRADGTLRAGSSYETRFRREDATTSEPEIVAKLMAKLSQALRMPFELSEARTAVRPCLVGQRTVAARHPAHPRLACLNGLGSKGALKSPSYARQLVEHLFEGKALAEELPE